MLDNILVANEVWKRVKEEEEHGNSQCGQ